MDLTRIDQIVQFALARAAHEDDWSQRELGPIHLIKYVYLADLAYAREHGGATYTGIKWRFYHFGPWSPEVFGRLDLAAASIGATTRTFEVAGPDTDGKRYTISETDADTLQRRLDRALPPEVTNAVSRAVHQFGSDTNGLLHSVYRTGPMLRAAPNEPLDFSLTLREPTVASEPAPELSRRQEKKLESSLAAAREAFSARLAAVKSRTTSAQKSPPPRYDEVFAEGVKAMDEEAAVEPLKGELSFPDDIWKSGWRDPHGSQ